MYQYWYEKAMRFSGYQIRKFANFPGTELAWTLKRCDVNPPMGGFFPDTDLQICATALACIFQVFGAAHPHPVVVKFFWIRRSGAGVMQASQKIVDSSPPWAKWSRSTEYAGVQQ